MKKNEDHIHNIQTDSKLPEDEILDATLRPKRINDYIGQSLVKENLGIIIQAAKGRDEACDHILMYGPPGLGKTTLAHIIANEIGSRIHITSGPALERSGDLAALLSSLEENDILFIDEIHRLHRTVEEILYPAMEDYCLDIILGKGPSAKILRIDLPKFTLIGATTKIGNLSSPLRDRFGSVNRLEYYTEKEIEKILERSAKILGIELNRESLGLIAERCRRTPRTANRILKRIRDYAQVKNKGLIDRVVVQEAFSLLQVDQYGLDNTDRDLLETIISKFNGGPVGLGTLAAALSEDKNTIEEVYEPYLMQTGFLIRTLQGRKVTDLAYRHLGIEDGRLI